MDRAEISRRYQISQELLHHYEVWDLARSGQRPGQWVYDGEDLARLSLVSALKNMGFPWEEIRLYLEWTLQKEDAGKRIRLLDQRRGTLLEEIHGKELQLQRLDELRCALRKHSKVS